MKPFLRGACAALLALPALAQAADATWVEESNRNAQIVLDVLARFNPEFAGNLGVEGYDDKVVDLGPRLYERNKAAFDETLAELDQRRTATADGPVRQDLDILINTVRQNSNTARLQNDLVQPYFGVAQLVFSGIDGLLDPRVSKERQAKAVVRLQRYAGLAPDSKAVTELAQARMAERFPDAKLLKPFKGQVEQDLADTPRYVEGLKQMLAKSGLTGHEAALAAIEKQLLAHDEWVRAQIMPRTRDDASLPPLLYADQLVQAGVEGIEPDELIRRALLSFAEIRNEMQALAPRVAKEKGFKVTDYRDVIAELKKKQLVGESILPVYRERLKKIEGMIRDRKVITLPQREAVIRLATEAESTRQPAPHMSPPRLLGNTGERGEFVLPLVVPAKAGEAGLRMDDFTFDAATWTLTVHEARPGHELQFAAMIERGVSIARAIFAFNSVNVEGWALYAEAEMKPEFPLDGQLIGLQHRMMRAARAFLDPMVNLGRLTPAQVNDFLMKEVCLSAGMAKQEVDRYTFRAPGQATSYFVGYQALMATRQRAQLQLGAKFDRQRFHDFVLSQGLLPPALLEQAVLTEFVAAEQKRGG